MNVSNRSSEILCYKRGCRWSNLIDLDNRPYDSDKFLRFRYGCTTEIISFGLVVNLGLNKNICYKFISYKFSVVAQRSGSIKYFNMHSLHQV